MADYDGPVVFVNGVHYPVFPKGHKEEGHANVKRPLRAGTDGWYDAAADDDLHNDVNHANDVFLEPGEE